MSGLDIFAWIVLIVLAISTVGVICIMGWLPGHIARERRHPWAQAVGVAGWITLLFGFVLWPVAFVWAYVDVPTAPAAPAAPDAPTAAAAPTPRGIVPRREPRP